MAALSASVSCGGELLFNIATDNVQVAQDLLKTVGKTVVTLGGLYLCCELLKPLIEKVVKSGFGGERDDQEFRGIRPGSLHVLLHCSTDERFLEVLADYESRRMKERLQEEFSQVGITVEGLKVEIENMAEVNETKEAIRNRYHVKKDLCEDVKNVGLTSAKSDVEKQLQSSRSEKLSSTPPEESIMKPLPRDKFALYQEAFSLGLIGPNPNLQKPRAKLIDYVNSSWATGRSMNHVSIVLVGSSGVGKSSTINHLLGTKDEKAKTSYFRSETGSTNEFIICGSEPRYEVKELPLGIVDTPGFGDTAGSNQDACNFYSIEKFFRTHPKLKDCYPNLIFLVVRATDNRLIGENSELAKSCRCVKQLNIVDPMNPNVVAIITHACGISYRNLDKWSKRMEMIRFIVETIIFKALKVTAPVVMLENMYGEDYDLEVCDDYTLLPNGVLQPKNLYVACARVLKDHKDNLGLITLNSIFAPSTKVPPPKRGHKIEAKSAKSCKLNDGERKFVVTLERKSRGGLSDLIIDTVLQYIEEKGIEHREREELTKIAEILRKLAGEGDPPNFGLHSLGSIEYFLGEDVSSTGRKMLQEKFKFAMEPRKTDRDTGRLVGQGYNILTDKSTATQVFKFDVINTKYGIVIPTCAKFEKVQQTRSFMDQFENDESYTESRLKNLNISIDVKPNVSMRGRRAGFNRNDYSTPSKFYSFLYEQRMFEVKVANYKEYLDKGMTFTKDFRSAVERLPCTYVKNDPSCRSSFERFFDRFGHFLVSSAYGGGSVEVECSREMIASSKASVEEVKAVLTATFEGLDVSNTEFNTGASFIDGVNAKALLNQCHISWEGGDTFLHEKETIANKEKMWKWKTSLLVQPTMLTSEMTLEPISTAVACLDPEKDQATYDALRNLLGGQFEYFVKKERQSILTKLLDYLRPTKREGTVEDPVSSGGCFPSSSVINVWSKDGVVKQKKMVKLEVGDKVMGWDEKRNRAVCTEVIMFAHRASDAMDVEYLKIALEDGNKITLSGNHLVMVGKHKKAILAQKVKRGEILFTVDENREISPKKVLAVDKVIEQGVYCPITVHGNLIVDNVLASCYASIQDHVFLEGLVKISAQSIAHFGLMPMRALHKLRLKWWRKIPNGQTIHPYLQWLCKFKLPFMAN